MSNAVIETQGLGKRYAVGEFERYRALRDVLSEIPRTISRALRSAERRPDSHIWALRNVNLRVQEGEIVGIIGRNGSGKSTLLKLLTRITDPTEGRARLVGRVGALLEVGSGFHPELTGRENVFVNGAILGMTREEIKRKFDAIVAFAGVEQFIDTPVKRYSSGMRVRLAFAVAAHVETEVLILDEVLAVGDVAFQRKCFEMIGQASRSGRTVLFVSHDLQAIQTQCARAVLLAGGEVQLDGPCADVVRTYLSSSLAQSTSIPLAERGDRLGDGSFRFTGVDFLDKDGIVVPYLQCGAAVGIRLHFSGNAEIKRKVEIGLWFRERFGRRLMCCYTQMTNADFDTLPQSGHIVCRIPKLPLAPGQYTIDLAAGVAGSRADKLSDAVEATVVTGDYFGTGHKVEGFGEVLCEHSWHAETPALQLVSHRAR